MNNGNFEIIGENDNIYAIKFYCLLFDTVKNQIILDLNSFDKKKLLLKLSVNKKYETNITLTKDNKMIKSFTVNKTIYENSRVKE